MLRLTKRRRELLAEKFGDLGNFAVAALVFGQAVEQDVFSLGIGLAGISTWVVFTLIAFYLGGTSMSTAFFMLGGIALIGLIIVALDWYGQRKNRQSKDHRTA